MGRFLGLHSRRTFGARKCLQRMRLESRQPGVEQAAQQPDA
jgi:hypothetical protein